MSFWKKLLGKGTASHAAAKHSVSSNQQKPAEKDNAGMRLEAHGEAEAYVMASYFRDDRVPIVLYYFDEEKEATQALSELSCIRVAEDSGKPICNDVLTFGVFPAKDSKPTWGALLSGKSLTHDLWMEAHECFKRHRGWSKLEHEPLKSTSSRRIHGGDPNSVTFSHERQQVVGGGPATYRHHKAPNKASAVAWLQQHPVDKRSYFLVVETPEGTFGRDIQGISEA